MKKTLRIESLQGKTFLDVGSGSGLHSLVARQLGAKVNSFDYDPHSVACTRELKRRYYRDDPDWEIEEGSALDKDYLSKFGQFDVVYSWGVLHHTGRMYESFKNVIPIVASQGKLFIAIYNNPGSGVRYWTLVKKIYNKNFIGRFFMILLHAPYLYVLRSFVRALTGRLALDRGMSLWHDFIDWVGGYPFEAARPEEIFHFFRDRGFVLEELKTHGAKMGCNEFVFFKRE